MENEIIEFDGIEYDMQKMSILDYILTKMNEYIIKVGFEKSIKSQKFIRHLHIYIALKLQKELKIPAQNIHFEVRLKNKNIDIGIIEDNEIKLAISIKSQTGSIKKNFTNNVNSLQGEVVSIKSSYPQMKTGVVYLFKETDMTNQENCLEYYKENIPKKLLPIISGGLKDRFDAGCIIIWDVISSELHLEENDITRVFSIDNFVKEIGEIYNETLLKSQFTVADLDKEQLEKFLKSS